MKRLLLACMAIGAFACSTPNADPYAGEKELGQKVARAALDATDAGRVLDVASSIDCQFDEGFSKVQYNPADDLRGYAFRWMADNAHVRLRSHGDRTMKIVMAGWIDEKILKTKIAFNFYVDGNYVPVVKDHVPAYVAVPLEDPKFQVEVEVPARFLRRNWVDLRIRPTSVSAHWLRVVNLRAIVIDRFEWKEADK